MEEIKITAVRQTKKGRFALFCEDEFLFSLDSETFFTQHIQEGTVFTAADLALLRQKSDTRKAKDKALEYLSLRDYASKELYDKLCLKFDPHSAAQAVAKMQELGLLNDRGFALHRARYLMNQRKSRSQILYHLAQKGVDRQTASEVLDEISAQAQEDPDLRAACKLLEKSYKRKLQQGKRQNVIAALARRGFSMGCIRAALEWYEQEYPPEEEFEED